MFQDGFDEVRSRRTFYERENHHFSAGSFDHFPSDSGLLGPIPSFDEDMRLKRRDEFERGLFIKYGYVIHTFKAREDFRPLLLRKDGSFRTFQALNRTITVYPHDQYITEGFGFFQITDMAEMKKVETAIGEDDPLSLFLEILDNPMEIFFCFDLFLQFLLLFKTYQI
jgi:hypothetical protein